MRFVLFFLTMAMCLSFSPAWAEEFYVELGRATSEAEAKSQWAELQANYPKILGKYGVYPNQILQPDGALTYRVQAGPMLDKQEAQRVCNRLFRRKVSCFLIEGFDPKNPQTFAKSNEQAPAIVSFSDFVLPWLSSSAPKEETPPPAPAPAEPAAKPEVPANAKAKVDVAEAIPVPVSDTNEVTVGEPLTVSTFEQTPPKDLETGTPGWLAIKPFLDEGRAKSFWRDVKQQAREATRGLSMKLVHPLVSHDLPTVILVVGRFESEEKALAFCRDQISHFVELECRFSVEPPEGEDAAAAKIRQAAADPDEYSLFWVEVLNEKSQDKALEKWERIRTDNDDLLSDVRSQITASMLNPGRYVVRIGPLKAKSKATALCNALKGRKVKCALSSL